MKNKSKITDNITVSGRSKKISLHQVQKKLKEKRDPTDDNVQKLLLLSGKRINSEISEKIIDRAVNKRYSKKEEKPKVEESTAFTEEDFKNFERDYVE